MRAPPLENAVECRSPKEANQIFSDTAQLGDQTQPIEVSEAICAAVGKIPL
jgi:hypothetical protein